MIRATLIAVLCSAALPARADTPMTLDAFEAFVTGRTFTYANAGGIPYGIEGYRENREVVWTIFESTCKTGRYYQGPGDLICFYYSANDNEDCWLFYPNTDGKSLTAISDTGNAYDVAPTTQSAACVDAYLGA